MEHAQNAGTAAYYLKYPWMSAEKVFNEKETEPPESDIYWHQGENTHIVMRMENWQNLQGN